MKNTLDVRLLRHATLVVEVARKRILVDPMLSKMGELDPVANAGNNTRIPLVDLPIEDLELEQLLNGTDAVLVTHTHRDHWDLAAQEKIGKNTLVFCQPTDLEKIAGDGFTNVHAIESSVRWDGITIYRTGGQHGTGETGKRMGPVSGYVIVYKRHRLYIAGDTIWCEEVQDAIATYQPNHIIVNGGGAQFLVGGPITMTVYDVLQLSLFTRAPIDVVHLEAVNHCLQKRIHFQSGLYTMWAQIRVPKDGDWLTTSKPAFSRHLFHHIKTMLS